MQEAEKYTELLTSISTATGDLWFGVLADFARATFAMDTGRFELAVKLFTQVLDLARLAQDVGFEVSCLQTLGLVAKLQHNGPLAKEYFAAAIACQHRVGNKIPIGWAYTHLAEILCEESKPAQALTNYQQAMQLRNNVVTRGC